MSVELDAFSGRVGDWCQTISGGLYWPVDPRSRDIVLEDIVHATSQICRFGGHCKRPYSVLEHSVLVSAVVAPEHALQGLAHDFTEAYVGDMVRPLKSSVAGYAEIEDQHWSAICLALGVAYHLHPTVKQADNNVLLAEKEALLAPCKHTWSVPGTPAPVVVRGVGPRLARWMFWSRWGEINRRGLPRRTRLWWQLRARAALAVWDILHLRTPRYLTKGT